jgi:hypothetical protein
MKKTNSNDYWWSVHCTLIIVCIMLALSASGCSALFGDGDYQSYSQALVDHSESEKGRVTSQAYEISTIAQNSMKYASTPTEALLVGVIATMTIGNLHTSQLDIKKPTTGMDVASSAVSHIPFIASSLSLLKLGEAGILAAGNVEIGANSTVSGSFNDTTATALGSTATATATGTATPTIVEQPAPVIVQ